MAESLQMSDVLQAAYAEGVKVAFIDAGYPEESAHEWSEKIAQDYPNVEFRMGPSLATRSTEVAPAHKAERKGILGRLLPSASIGATLGLLGGAGLMAARRPAWRKEFMKVVNRKKDGGVMQALKELSQDTAGIQTYTIPGAIGGGAVGLMSGE